MRRYGKVHDCIYWWKENLTYGWCSIEQGKWEVEPKNKKWTPEYTNLVTTIPDTLVLLLVGSLP